MIKETLAIAVALILAPMAIGAADSFSLEVTPDKIAGAILGQLCVLLVALQGDIGGPVRISAELDGAGSVTLFSEEIAQGQIGEIGVSVGKNLTVVVRGERGGLVLTDEVVITVLEGEGHLLYRASEKRDAFIP
jgi:hypothetical protein